MARIRTIKPEFFTSEDIVGLSPLARLLYVATWLEADREGRLQWRPKTLKMRYLPNDSCDIDELTAELIDAGLIVTYEVDGAPLAEIPTFTRHQVINNRETASALPPRAIDASATREARAIDASARVKAEGKGKEGKEGNDASSTRDAPPVAAPPTPRPAKDRKTPMPQGFGVSARVTAWAREKGHGDLEQHLDAFKAKCAANGYTYADWDAAFMEAIRGDWAKLSAGQTGGRPGRRRPVLDAEHTFGAAR